VFDIRISSQQVSTERDDFFRAKMGHRFFEATMPKVADDLERINMNLEPLVAAMTAASAGVFRLAMARPKDTRTRLASLPCLRVDVRHDAA
jgi:hypothetical protein